MLLGMLIMLGAQLDEEDELQGVLFIVNHHSGVKEWPTACLDKVGAYTRRKCRDAKL